MIRGTLRAADLPSRCIINKLKGRICRKGWNIVTICTKNTNPNKEFARRLKIVLLLPRSREVAVCDPLRAMVLSFFRIAITRNRLSIRKSRVSRLASGITGENLVKRRKTTVPLSFLRCSPSSYPLARKPPAVSFRFFLLLFFPRSLCSPDVARKSETRLTRDKLPQRREDFHFLRPWIESSVPRLLYPCLEKASGKQRMVLDSLSSGARNQPLQQPLAVQNETCYVI